MREQVLDLISRHLQGPLKPTGSGNYQTRCPFHKGGQEKSPSFGINPDKGIFNCFTCHVGGDVELLLKLLGLPDWQVEAEIKNIRPVLQRNRELHQFEKKHAFVETNPFLAPVVLPEAMTGIYDWMPTTLVEKGFYPDVLRYMGVGFDRAKQRVIYPIRDLHGQLAGFVGGAAQPGQVPKYKVYEGTQRNNGVVTQGDYGDWFDEQFPAYKFENHDFLWNFHRVYKSLVATSDPSATVFVVEGYKACMWMLQAGYLNTVALMGSYISERQQQLLQLLNCQVVLFLDNDEAGRRGAVWVGELLFKKMGGRIFVVPYPKTDEDTQPDDYFPAGIQQFVQHSIPFLQWQTGVLQSQPDLLQKVQKRRGSKWQ